MKNYLEARPKIFLGSSSRSYGLVQWLAQEIRANEIGIPIPWKSGGFAPSKSTLQNLLEQCMVCDFAVIFLTRDDAKREKDNSEKIFKGPRDNTIFEAGLFVGGLGLQPERCVLVSSVDESNLPSDIKGITYVEIDEPPPPDPPFHRLSDEWCRENLQRVYESVELSVNKYGEFLKRPLLNVLTKKQLAIREQVGKSYLERYDKVFINSSEPSDCCEFVMAKAVAENIRNKVFYQFHYRVQKEDLDSICSQWIDHIRILIAAYCIHEKSSYSEGDLKKDEDIRGFIKSRYADAKIAIDDIRNHLKFFIHLEEGHPMPFRVAVHNVSSFEKAKCYLRHGDLFVEWFLKEEARAAIKQIAGRQVLPYKKAIFQKTDMFDIYDYCENGSCDEEMLTIPVARDMYEKMDSLFKETKLTDENKVQLSIPKEFFRSLRRVFRSTRIYSETDTIPSPYMVRKKLYEKINELFYSTGLESDVLEACLGDDNHFQDFKNEYARVVNGMVVEKDGSVSDKGCLLLQQTDNWVFQDDSLETILEKLKLQFNGNNLNIPVLNNAGERKIVEIVNKQELKEFLEKQAEKSETLQNNLGEFNRSKHSIIPFSVISEAYLREGHLQAGGDIAITENGLIDGPVKEWISRKE